MSSQMAVQHDMTTTVLSPIELEDVEVDEELVGFREIMDKGEEFTWDSLVDKEEEDVVLSVSQDEPMVVD